jgi:uncharacterized membrane protein YdjX (TVP38/TMEM64 family)
MSIGNKHITTHAFVQRDLGDYIESCKAKIGEYAINIWFQLFIHLFSLSPSSLSSYTLFLLALPFSSFHTKMALHSLPALPAISFPAYKLHLLHVNAVSRKGDSHNLITYLNFKTTSAL